MPIIAKEPESKPFEIIPAGNYVARCYSMIYLGTQTSVWAGKEIQRERIRITWELPTEIIGESEKPFVIGQEYTLSLSDKGNLRPMLEGWRGKGFTPEELKEFDITKIISVPCLLNVIHNDSKDGKNTYANIANVSPLPKGMQCPKQINETMIFEFEDIYSEESINKLPEWLQKKVRDSLEYKGQFNGKTEEINIDELTKAL